MERYEKGKNKDRNRHKQTAQKIERRRRDRAIIDDNLLRRRQGGREEFKNKGNAGETAS